MTPVEREPGWADPGRLLQDVELSDVEVAELAEQWRQKFAAYGSKASRVTVLDPPAGSAWRHQCGQLNDGPWINPDERLFCEGCRCAVKRDSEIVGKYTLRHAEGRTP